MVLNDVHNAGLGNDFLVCHQCFTRLQSTSATAKSGVLVESEDTLLVAVML